MTQTGDPLGDVARSADSKTQSWWQTLPGLLTAAGSFIAACVTAATALYTVFHPVSASPPLSSNPSFPCGGGNLTTVERIICSNAPLGALDQQVAASFNRALARGTADADRQLRFDQQSWINQRNACADVACVTSLYVKRLP